MLASLNARASLRESLYASAGMSYHLDDLPTTRVMAQNAPSVTQTTVASTSTPHKVRILIDLSV